MKTTARLLATPALLAIALSACVRGHEPPADAEASATNLVPPAAADASGDTSTIGIARAALGAEVRRAAAFRAGGGEWIAAVRDAAKDGPDPLDANANASRYGYEVVVLERTAGGWTARAPGLLMLDEQDHGRRAEVDRVERAPDLPPARSPDLLWGMGDVDGDGDPEPWTVQILSGASAFAIDLRAFDPAMGTLYRFQAPSTERPERLDHARAELSPSAARNPAVRRWLAARADSITAAWIAATLAEG
jgi:hypothetical protein